MVQDAGDSSTNHIISLMSAKKAPPPEAGTVLWGESEGKFPRFLMKGQSGLGKPIYISLYYSVKKAFK